MIKILNCQCGGKLTDFEMVDFYGSIGDGYLTEEHEGFCEKCGKSYVITMTATISPENTPIQISMTRNDSDDRYVKDFDVGYSY
jgi:hypothetical protein